MNPTEYRPGRPYCGVSPVGSDEVPCAPVIIRSRMGEHDAYHQCPVCHEEILEEHDFLTNRIVSNNYTRHYVERHHKGEASNMSDQTISDEQRAEALAAAEGSAPEPSLSERHQIAEEKARQASAAKPSTRRSGAKASSNGSAKPSEPKVGKMEQLYGKDVAERRVIAATIPDYRGQATVKQHAAIRDVVVKKLGGKSKVTPDSLLTLSGADSVRKLAEFAAGQGGRNPALAEITKAVNDSDATARVRAGQVAASLYAWREQAKAEQ